MAASTAIPLAKFLVAAAEVGVAKLRPESGGIELGHEGIVEGAARLRLEEGWRRVGKSDELVVPAYRWWRPRRSRRLIAAQVVVAAEVGGTNRRRTVGAELGHEG